MSKLSEEFFDAHDSLEEKSNEDEEYNDYNFWKIDLSKSYDLDRLMQEMWLEIFHLINFKQEQ